MSKGKPYIVYLRSRDYIYCFTIWRSRIVVCPETSILTEDFCIFQFLLAIYGAGGSVVVKAWGLR
jgi:hypothetical protein